MIKIIFSTIFFTCLAVSAFSQIDTTYLSIVAGEFYTPPKEGQELLLIFEEDKSNCDPATGYVSVEDQKNDFFESLSIYGINAEDFTYETLESIPRNDRLNNRRLAAYTYFSNDDTKIDKVIEAAKLRVMTIKRFKEIYKQKKLEDQDGHAINALRKINQKAEMMAAHLGYKNVQLISIDDDTRGVNAIGLLSQYLDYSYASSLYNLRCNYKMY